MGHSRDEKSKSHQRIVEIAAARMRESGTAGPGVAEIMQEAGLTHGGFYKHFGSRDQLVAEATRAAFDEGHDTFVRLTTGVDDRLSAFVDRYTSTEHRDGAGVGCAIAALGSDVARGSEDLRVAYARRVEGFIGELESLLAEGEGAGGDAGSVELRRQAVLSVSSLVGAVVLARAVGDDALSREILGDVASAVKAQAASELPAEPQSPTA